MSDRYSCPAVLLHLDIFCLGIAFCYFKNETTFLAQKRYTSRDTYNLSVSNVINVVCSAESRNMHTMHSQFAPLR